jgi:hypothetical protein
LPQTPVAELVPEPQAPLSQSPFLWQVWPPPLAHVPSAEPEPAPQELLSQSAFFLHA